jgi:hypothetical protein
MGEGAFRRVSNACDRLRIGLLTFAKLSRKRGSSPPATPRGGADLRVTGASLTQTPAVAGFRFRGDDITASARLAPISNQNEHCGMMKAEIARLAFAAARRARIQGVIGSGCDPLLPAPAVTPHPCYLHHRHPRAGGDPVLRSPCWQVLASHVGRPGSVGNACVCWVPAFAG